MPDISHTPRQLAKFAAEIYGPETKAKVRFLQRLRPYICPLHDILEHVPTGSRVMDVGCGAGLFLLLLAHTGRLQAGFGFDVSTDAIAAASMAADRIRAADRVRFLVRAVEAGIPASGYAVVSAIDVIHHIPPGLQRRFVEDLCQAVPTGGRLIIKDMATEPRWRALANHAHDAVMARQRVHHAAMSEVESWTRPLGFVPVHRAHANVLWYAHWTLVLDRSSARPASPSGPVPPSWDAHSHAGRDSDSLRS